MACFEVKVGAVKTSDSTGFFFSIRAGPSVLRGIVVFASFAFGT